MTANANVQSLHDAVTARIISELEAGCFPWVQPWASSTVTPPGLPQNASTGRSYSDINILVLWFAAIEQGRSSQRWLTFKQALALGGHVRKGEKGILVVYADAFIPRAEQEKATMSGKAARRVGFLKRFTVFHIEQCEGLPAGPAAPQFPRWSEALPHVEAVIAATDPDIRVGGEMSPWPSRAVLQFEDDFDPSPSTGLDLVRLVLRRLDDMQHALVASDFAKAATLRLLPGETAIQNWLADRFRGMQAKAYSIEREPHAVGEKRLTFAYDPDRRT